MRFIKTFFFQNATLHKNTGLRYIRCEGYTFSHIGDEGWIDSCAGELLRYRKQIEAENVCVFTDIKKKHR